MKWDIGVGLVSLKNSVKTGFLLFPFLISPFHINALNLPIERNSIGTSALQRYPVCTL